MTSVERRRDVTETLSESTKRTEREVPTDDLALVDAWWRAANYLAVGQIYLMDNPLLHEPLRPEHLKPRLLGHWGTTPGLTFLWAHLNRVIVREGLEALFVAGPGHGGPAVVATAWLEGTYSERYANVPPDAEGMRQLFRQFSFPGGVPSHASPETPGSNHEGGGRPAGVTSRRPLNRGRIHEDHSPTPIRTRGPRMAA